MITKCAHSKKIIKITVITGGIISILIFFITTATYTGYKQNIEYQQKLNTVTDMIPNIIAKSKSKDEAQAAIQWQLDAKNNNKYKVIVSDLNKSYGIDIKKKIAFGLTSNNSLYKDSISKPQ